MDRRSFAKVGLFMKNANNTTRTELEKTSCSNDIKASKLMVADANHIELSSSLLENSHIRASKPPDRIFTTKLGLLQSLMVQDGTHILNVTLKRYPKKFWGLFGQKDHKTQQITLFHSQKGGLSLTLTSQGQTYNPKCKAKQLRNGTLGFIWDGSAHSAHNTANFSDWLVSQE